MRNRIKEFRTKDGVTLKYISYVSNVSISYLSQLELGRKQNPSFDTMYNISKALRKPINEVFF